LAREAEYHFFRNNCTNGSFFKLQNAKSLYLQNNF